MAIVAVAVSIVALGVSLFALNYTRREDQRADARHKVWEQEQASKEKEKHAARLTFRALHGPTGSATYEPPARTTTWLGVENDGETARGLDVHVSLAGIEEPFHFTPGDVYPGSIVRCGYVGPWPVGGVIEWHVEATWTDSRDGRQRMSTILNHVERSE
jgi:hypothetical protein